MRPLLAARLGGGDAALDFVEPEHRRRHVLHHAARLDEGAFGLAVTSREDLHHVHAVERQSEMEAIAFTQRLFPQPGMPISRTPLGTISAESSSRISNSLRRSSSHFLRFSRPPTSPIWVPVGDELDGAAAVDQQPLFFKQRGHGIRPELPARGQSAAQSVACFIQRQTLQGARHLVQHGLGGMSVLRRDALHFVAQEIGQLHVIRRAQFQEQHDALQFLRNQAHRRGDHHELALVQAAFVHVAQAAADLRRFAQRRRENP